MSSSETGCQRYSIPAGILTYVDSNGTVQNINTAGLMAFYEIGCHDKPRVPYVPGITPFSWSVSPILFILSGICTTSWLLFILLNISRQQRPWLQKLAILVLSISLTIILSRLTDQIRIQYDNGFENSWKLIQHVLFSYCFRILYVVSLIFLWAAHIQVLVRLFNRRREKFWIKIISGFMTLVNVVLWCAALFTKIKEYDVRKAPSYADDTDNVAIVNTDMTQYHPFHGQIVIVATVFDIILHAMYGVLILVYTGRQKRFAYQWKHSLIIILSILSFLVPIIFLVTGLVVFHTFVWASTTALVAGAGSTVVVWDWIDVIEAGERKEESSGIVGRPIYEKKIAGEYEKMSGVGGGQGGTTSRTTKRYRSAAFTPDSSASPHPMATLPGKLWGWTAALFQRAQNKSPSNSDFTTASVLDRRNSNIENLIAAPSESATTSPSRQVILKTTPMDLSSFSPVGNSSKLKKFSYAVKRGKLSAPEDEDDNGDDDLYDNNPADDENISLHSDTVVNSLNNGIESEQLPEFHMIPGYDDVRDYHDDKS